MTNPRKGMVSGIVRAESDLRTRFRANHKTQSLKLKRLIGHIISVLCLRAPNYRARLAWDTQATKTVHEQFPFRELLLRVEFPNAI